MDDPLFLHHGESPNTVLVTQPLTGSENYSAWARAVRKALLTKKQARFHRWHTHFVISIGVHAFSRLSLDQV